jgi:hypothetical protein
MRRFALLLVLVACQTVACQAEPKHATTVNIGASDAAAEIPVDPHIEMLAAADRGERPKSPLFESWAPTVISNLTPIPVGPMPAPTPIEKATKLTATRVPMPKELDAARWTGIGKVFQENGPETGPQAPPAWIPARLGNASLRSIRASDGRSIAMYWTRYVALVGDSRVKLLDFGKEPRLHFALSAGNTLYVYAVRAFVEAYIAAIDIGSGRVLWRTEAATFGEEFAVGETSIVAWRNQELVEIARDSGKITARRPTPEVDSGPPAFVTGNGAIYCAGTSELAGSKGLRNREALEIHVPLLPPKPPPADPVVGRVATLPPPVGGDARLLAWKYLDNGDPRRAMFALSAVLEARPTDLAAATLDHGARKALKAAREEAAKAILASFKPIQTENVPPGHWPVPLPKGPRTLKIISKKAIQPDQFISELPEISDELRVAPAYVPDLLGNRRRNEDAGAFGPNYRVEVYWGYGQPSWTLFWRDEKLISILEQPREVRAAEAIGDVVFTVNNDQGRFFLEAHDGRTGSLSYRGTTLMHDQYFVAQDGYLVMGTAEPAADVVLVEGGTGNIVSRANIPAPQSAFIIIRKGNDIAAVNQSTSLVVGLQ